MAASLLRHLTLALLPLAAAPALAAERCAMDDRDRKSVV